MRPRPAARRRAHLLALALATAVGLGSTLVAVPAQAADDITVTAARPDGTFHTGDQVTASAPVDNVLYYNDLASCEARSGAFVFGLVQQTTQPTLPLVNGPHYRGDRVYRYVRVADAESSRFSACSEIVPPVPFTPQPVVSIGDRATIGEELSVTVTGGFTPAVGQGTQVTVIWEVQTVANRWQQVKVGEGFVPQQTYLGKPVRARVALTAPDRVGEVVGSPSLTISEPGFADFTPKISGSGKAGEKLTVSAETTPTPESYAYSWTVGDDTTVRSTATTFTPTLADTGKTAKVTVTAKGTSGEPEDRSASATKAVVNGPGFTGDLKVGNTITLTELSQVYLYNTPDCTGLRGDLSTRGSLTFSAIFQGRYIQAVTDREGTCEGPIAAGTFAAPKPTITGEAEVGRTVQADPGDVDTLPEQGQALNYRWSYGNGAGTIIDGATTSSLKIPAAANGKPLRVTVSYAAPGYESADGTSDAVSVGAGSFTAPEVTVEGTPRVGSKLTASFDESDLPEGYTPSYEWQADYGEGYSAIAKPRFGDGNETDKTYTPSAFFVGKSVRVQVTFSADGYATPGAVLSDAVTIGNGTIDLGQPVISDTSPQVGDVLTATTSGVPAGVTPVTTWGTYDTFAERCDLEQVPSAKRRVTSADLDKRLCVKVAASAAGYDGDEATSVPTEKVAKGTFTVSPLEVQGGVRVGKPVVLSGGEPPYLDEDGASFRYDWFVTDADGQFQQVEGVSGPSLTPLPAMEGRKLKVTVAVDVKGYETATTTSETVTIQKGSFQAPKPTVSGDGAVGSTLTASTDLSDLPDGTKVEGYQWAIGSESFTDLDGATSSTLKVPAVAKNQAVRVTVTFTAPGYEDASTVSLPTSIGEGTFAAPKVTIDGSPKVGSELTATFDEENLPEGWSAAYEWQVENGEGFSPIPSGAESSESGKTYVPTVDLEGKSVRVQVTFSADGYGTPDSSFGGPVTVGQGDLDLAAPVISDSSPMVGEALTVEVDAPRGATVKRFWGTLNAKGDCVTIDVEAGSFIPGVADLGRRVCVVVEVSDVDGYEDDVQVASTQERVREPRSMKLSDTTIRKGQTFTISATDLEPGRSYTISVYDRKLTGVAGANGRISRTFTYPAKTATAKRTIALSQYDGKARTFYQVVALTYTAKK